MTASTSRKGFASRPADPENWIRAGEGASARRREASAFTARLTIDVTPDQRARIKIVAFEHGITVAEMLRDLLAREFPPSDGEMP